MAVFGVLSIVFPGAVIASPPDGVSTPAAGADSPNPIILIVAAGAILLIFLRRWHRLPSPTTPRTAEVIMRCSLLFLAMLLVAPFAAGMVKSAIAFSDPLTIRDLAIILAAAAMGRAVIAYSASRLGAWPPARRSSRCITPRASFLITGIAIILILPIVAATGEIAGFLSSWFTQRPTDAIAHDTLLAMIESPRDLWFWLLAALVIIAGPILEEITYREYLQQSLIGALGGPWTAIIGASIIFVLFHATIARPEALAPLFALSLGLGWLRQRTNGLAAPIALHATFNAVNLALAMSMAR